MSITSGTATRGRGGGVDIAVGQGDSGDGGNVVIKAGVSSAEGATAGEITLSAGDMKDPSGRGGDMKCGSPKLLNSTPPRPSPARS